MNPNDSDEERAIGARFVHRLLHAVHENDVGDLFSDAPADCAAHSTHSGDDAVGPVLTVAVHLHVCAHAYNTTENRL